jgi:hypothetical protein
VQQWLGAFFGSSNARRLFVAIAVSIALHEILAGLIPGKLMQMPSSREVVTRAQVLRVTIRPPATPAPRRARHVIALAQPRTIARAPGRARDPHAIHSASVPRPKPMTVTNSKPVWDMAIAAQPGASLAASGGPGGKGSGTTGNGNGAAAADEPCGFVVFSDPHGSQFDRRTHGFWVDIRMSVHFADGSSQSMILDYPWYYASEADNPWSDQNLKDPNFLPRFQSPPAQKTDAEPPLVKYVIQHSTRDGLTLLKDCPTPAPTPAV